MSLSILHTGRFFIDKLFENAYDETVETNSIW